MKRIASPYILLASLVTPIFMLQSGCSKGLLGKAASSGQISISGVVSAGPINGATVTIYNLNSDGSRGSNIGSGTTDSNGSFHVSVTLPSGPVMMVASGGSYNEEASGSTVSMGNAQVRTVLSNVNDGQQVGITPVTEIATQHALASATANGSANLGSIIEVSNATVAAAMGLPDITITPANPTQPAGVANSTQSAQYALVLSSISQMADVATTSAGSAVNSLDVMQALATSFTYNGSFDPMVGGQNVPITTASGSPINLGTVLAAAGGGGATFSSSMQSAMTTYAASTQATTLGFNDANVVPTPTFLTSPPPPNGAPALNLPTPPATLPATSPVASGPPTLIPSADSVAWANVTNITPNFTDWFLSVAEDSSGNVYAVETVMANAYVTAGPFSFGNDVSVYIAGGSARFVLVKYNSQGVAQWAKNLTGDVLGTNNLASVALDSSGNVYVVESFNGIGSVDFGNGVIGNLGSQYSGSALLVKFDASGVAQWVQPISAQNALCEFGTLALDGDGNIYVVGRAEGQPGGTCSFGTGLTATVTAPGGNGNAVLAKYDSSGVAQWIQTVNSDALLGSDFATVTTDSQGNIYVAGFGMVGGSFDFGNGVSATVSANSNASAVMGAIIAKYDATGAAIWAQSVSSTNLLASSFVSLAVDGNGNAYVVGNIDGPASSYSLGNGVSGSSGTTVFGSSFLAKYDSSGTPQWAHNLPGSDGSIFVSVAVDSIGHAFAYGNYGGSAVIGEYSSSGEMKKFSRLWAAQAGGMPGALLINSTGRMCVAGWVNSTSPSSFAGSLTVPANAPTGIVVQF